MDRSNRNGATRAELARAARNAQLAKAYDAKLTQIEKDLAAGIFGVPAALSLAFQAGCRFANEYE